MTVGGREGEEVETGEVERKERKVESAKVTTAFAGLAGQSLRGASAWDAASAGVDRRRDTGAVDVVLQCWQSNAWRRSPAWGKGVYGCLR